MNVECDVCRLRTVAEVGERCELSPESDGDPCTGRYVPEGQKEMWKEKKR